MNHNRSSKTGLEGLLLPFKVFFVIFVSLEHLRAKLLVWINFSLVAGGICLVLQIESNGELEIQLDSSTLMSTLQGIIHLDVNLGAIKSAISRVKLPWLSKFVQSIFESFLCSVPKLFTSKAFFWPG